MAGDPVPCGEKHKVYRQDCPDCGTVCWLCSDLKTHPTGHCHDESSCVGCLGIQDATIAIVAAQLRGHTGPGIQAPDVELNLTRDYIDKFRTLLTEFVRDDPWDDSDPVELAICYMCAATLHSEQRDGKWVWLGEHESDCAWIGARKLLGIADVDSNLTT